MISAFLAYEAKIEEDPRSDPLHDDTSFSLALRSLLEEVDNWPATMAATLLDRNNWLVERPHIYLKTGLTTKGNLCIDWSPADMHPNSNNAKQFKYWSTKRKYSRPQNRLLQISGFEYLMGETTLNSAYWLAKSVENVQSSIQNTIQSQLYTDVTQALDVRGTSKEFSNGPWLVSMQNSREEQTKQRDADINELVDTCKLLGCTPVQFLNNFKANNLKYAPTGRAHGISGGRVKTIINMIMNLFPETRNQIYPRPKAKVIPIR